MLKFFSEKSSYMHDYKQLLNEVFVISGIIKVEVSVISRSRRQAGSKIMTLVCLHFFLFTLAFSVTYML